jgi:hypothetical protein
LPIEGVAGAGTTEGAVGLEVLTPYGQPFNVSKLAWFTPNVIGAGTNMQFFIATNGVVTAVGTSVNGATDRGSDTSNITTNIPSGTRLSLRMTGDNASASANTTISWGFWITQ